MQSQYILGIRVFFSDDRTNIIIHGKELKTSTYVMYTVDCQLVQHDCSVTYNTK